MLGVKAIPVHPAKCRSSYGLTFPNRSKSAERKKMIVKAVIETEGSKFEWSYNRGGVNYSTGTDDRADAILVARYGEYILRTENDKPLLHGLFTLAVAFRALSKVVPLAEERIKRLEGKFSHPAFVGDELRVRIWGTEDESKFLFVITNAKSGQTLENDGVAEFMYLRSNL